MSIVREAQENIDGDIKQRNEEAKRLAQLDKRYEDQVLEATNTMVNKLRELEEDGLTISSPSNMGGDGHARVYHVYVKCKGLSVFRMVVEWYHYKGASHGDPELGIAKGDGAKHKIQVEIKDIRPGRLRGPTQVGKTDFDWGCQEGPGYACWHFLRGKLVKYFEDNPHLIKLVSND